MLDGRSLKRLEDLQTENKRLTKKLSELAVVIAVLKLTETRAALCPSGTLESQSRRTSNRRVARRLPGRALPGLRLVGRTVRK